MDRLENLMELVIADHVKFADEHNKLLTSQVLLTDRMDRLTVRMDRLAGTMQELAESQKNTDDRISVFVRMMDTFIRESGGRK